MSLGVFGVFGSPITDTHVPVPAGDARRMDIIVTGLNAHNGLPLFCDATVLTPLSGTGAPRGSTSNRGGALLEQAERGNDAISDIVTTSGVGKLLCLGCEVFVRWSQQAVELVPILA